MAAKGNGPAGAGQLWVAAGFGPCWRRFSVSTRPWEGAAGISCGPGGSFGGGFAGVAALSRRDFSLTTLMRGRAERWLTPMRGEPGS